MALVSRSSLSTRLMESCRWLQIKVNDGVGVEDVITLRALCSRLGY